MPTELIRERDIHSHSLDIRFKLSPKLKQYQNRSSSVMMAQREGQKKKGTGQDPRTSRERGGEGGGLGLERIL